MSNGNDMLLCSFRFCNDNETPRLDTIVDHLNKLLACRKTFVLIAAFNSV